MLFKIKNILLISFCLFSIVSNSQQATSKTVVIAEKNVAVVNRNFSLIKDQYGKQVIHLDAKPGAGVAWLKDMQFSNGIIEFDVKGKDVLQQSFVGIAFHGINDSTYEGVYFRPFNFQAKDPVRKKHAVQYISLPKYDWFYLRETYPDKYENALLSVVDPNSWFHVKVVVDGKSIKAFVNADVEPCLSVESITDNINVKLGFWVGNDADGDFKNLIISNKMP